MAILFVFLHKGREADTRVVPPKTQYKELKQKIWKKKFSIYKLNKNFKKFFTNRKLRYDIPEWHRRYFILFENVYESVGVKLVYVYNNTSNTCSITRVTYWYTIATYF